MVHRRIIKPVLLIGEGKEETLFFEAFLKHLGRQDDVAVWDYGGKSSLGSFLNVIRSVPGFPDLKSLGITRDADNDAGNAKKSIRRFLRMQGLPIPSRSSFFAEGPPKVGVFILPDGERPGMLEDLCLMAISKDVAMPCVDVYFQCLAEAGQQPAGKDMSKARIQAWLASRERPDRKLGEAAQKGEWPWDSPAFQRVREFLLGL